MQRADRVRAAHALAEQGLALLRAGDIDAFLAAVPDYNEALDAVLELAPGGSDPSLLASLKELVAAHGAVSDELAARKAAAGRRLARMRRGREVAGAYLATPPYQGFGHHQA